MPVFHRCLKSFLGKVGRVVYQNVNTAIGIHRFVSNPFRIGLFGNVGVDKNSLASSLSNLSHSLVSPFRIKIGDNDFGSFLGKK